MKRTALSMLLALLIAMTTSGRAETARDVKVVRHDDAASIERQDKPQDVSGAWALTVETDQGTGNPTVTFKQDGEKLTGTYSSQVFGEQEVTGTIKGHAITFSFTGTFEGTKFTVTYTGTVEKDTMKGKVALGEAGEGRFTGKKK